VELLRRRNKSAVFRLPGVGEKGSDVIAKHCLRQSALAEREVYETLQQLPFPSTRYYGYVGNRQGEFCWLFLEDAAGEPLDPDNPEQRELATRWLANLHTASGRLEAAARLPDRGPAHYRKHLRHARIVIELVRENMDLPPGGDTILRHMQLLLEELASRWTDMEAVCAAMPRALVHGDFAERNVRIRHNGKLQSQLLAFDWEVAGWGFPGVDLGFADLDVYHECVRSSWPHIDRDAVQRFAHVGRLLRGGIAAVQWEADKLEAGWSEKPLSNMLLYRGRIEEALQGLGWHASSPPASPTGEDAG
jgi:aminoglycoside phosphotransferase (APT) family kinase protein